MIPVLQYFVRFSYEGSNAALETETLCGQLCGELLGNGFDVLAAPIASQLELLAKQVARDSQQALDAGGELPGFSFAPAEYVTAIGEYLLLLPQHLDHICKRSLMTS